ncbi:MAG: nucleotidyltransferase domain-containing protein [Vicinamibacterales bacterium]
MERTIARVAASRREIQAAYLFGSRATGKSRPNSDVDIAVLVNPDALKSAALDYRLELMADFGAALHRADIDLVVLNHASPLLAHRVLSGGVLAFERSRVARVRFQVRTAAMYADAVPMYETHIRYLKQRAGRTRVNG